MNTLLILFAVALAVSSVGWKKFVYFISLGYGFSIAAMGIALPIIHHDTLTLAALLLALLLLIYGCRLGIFLLVREIRSASYRKELPNLTKTSKPMTAGTKLAIWFSCTLLYVMQVSPVAFRLINGAAADAWTWVGIGIAALGLIVESTADLQKSRAKKIAPKRFVDTGLYRIVRCPNYFGEILVWTGIFVSGIGLYANAFQWIFAALGYISIVYIMFGGARRLEIRQNKNYGSDPDYQKYVKSTPIILPLLPLYSVEKQTWLKG